MLSFRRVAVCEKTGVENRRRTFSCVKSAERSLRKGRRAGRVGLACFRVQENRKFVAFGTGDTSSSTVKCAERSTFWATLLALARARVYLWGVAEAPRVDSWVTSGGSALKWSGLVATSRFW